MKTIGLVLYIGFLICYFTSPFLHPTLSEEMRWLLYMFYIVSLAIGFLLLHIIKLLEKDNKEREIE